MEAAERGPIACLQDGDRIVIDIPGHKLEVSLSKEEIRSGSPSCRLSSQKSRPAISPATRRK